MKTNRIRGTLAKIGVVTALAVTPLLATAAPAQAAPPRGHCGFWSEAIGAMENETWYVNCHNANVELRIRVPQGDFYRCVGVGTTFLDPLKPSGTGNITSAVAVGVC
ncbi:DUF6355 family natural product biosynthesis protein [Amycolatopsis pittospori]|uniref:DUF6355 family natural product biosynthesis protein n=1 Tax=Amycolatopsis pittospori TaxID=2749434 RepID=UPI0015EFEF21|nr:DUF6355 family natural product biosynthesis protein [Amycolatopsis pittospori]